MLLKHKIFVVVRDEVFDRVVEMVQEGAGHSLNHSFDRLLARPICHELAFGNIVPGTTMLVSIDCNTMSDVIITQCELTDNPVAVCVEQNSNLLNRADAQTTCAAQHNCVSSDNVISFYLFSRRSK